ncbi:1735_t:CDS:10, partial [Ambispora gerdemannii]
EREIDEVANETEQIEPGDEAEAAAVAIENEEKEGDDDAAAMFSALKKKKKKKKSPLDASFSFEEEKLDEEVPAAETGEFLDLSTKKKKKKKPADLSEFEKQLKEGEEEETKGQEGGGSGDVFVHEGGEEEEKESHGEETWIGTDRDYTYSELLGRVFKILRQNNPELAGEKKRYTIVPPSVHREGNKKTIFANVADICKRMHRQPEHVIQFLFAELGTSGSIDGSQRLVIKACLQFNPILGQFEQNQKRASEFLAKYGPQDIDVVVLPELAFTGYVFNDKDHIRPFLEDAETGPTVRWAKEQAARLKAFVMVGYPQLVKGETDRYYNSICFVNPQGELVITYQKHFLYSTDEQWAEEGPEFKSVWVDGLGKVGFGICMDLNQYKFRSPWSSYEFATFHREKNTQIILCSMAWLDSDVSDDECSDVSNYWCARMVPLYYDLISSHKTRNHHDNLAEEEEGRRNEGDVIFVVCNRTGTENGTTFCGSSGVFLLSPKNNEAKLLKGLKKREENVLLIDVSNNLDGKNDNL